MFISVLYISDKAFLIVHVRNTLFAVFACFSPPLLRVHFSVNPQIISLQRCDCKSKYTLCIFSLSVLDIIEKLWEYVQLSRLNPGWAARCEPSVCSGEGRLHSFHSLSGGGPPGVVRIPQTEGRGYMGWLLLMLNVILIQSILIHLDVTKRHASRTI